MTALEQCAFRKASEAFVRETMYNRSANVYLRLERFLKTFMSLSTIPSDKEMNDMWLAFILQGDLEAYEHFRLVMAQKQADAEKADGPQPVIVEAKQ